DQPREQSREQSRRASMSSPHESLLRFDEGIPAKTSAQLGATRDRALLAVDGAVATRANGISIGIRSQPEWKLRSDLRPVAGTALDMDRSAQCLDPVGEADQHRFPRWIRSADAVVVNRQQ